MCSRRSNHCARIIVADSSDAGASDAEVVNVAMPMHARIGWRGEQLTVRFLRKLGYKILAVNFATSFGETDIIARARDGTVCFVEVKTRSSLGMFPPSDAVDGEKQKRLITNAHIYLNSADIGEKTKIRFDIAEIIADDIRTARINYIQNAFSEYN